ncbi:MAG: hypothetical protein ACXACX_10275 [Candidatus Hodarchaeales archaeon]|jgi:hypothetical protein
MTVSDNNLNEIFTVIRNHNPHHTNSQIHQKLGKVISEIYLNKIKELKMPKKIQRFEKAKLQKQRQRHSKKGKSKVDRVFRREKQISKFENIKSSIAELSMYHSSTDFDYKTSKSFESRISSNDRIEYLKKDYINKGDFDEFKINEESELSQVKLEKKFENRASRYKEKIDQENKNYSTLKSKDEKIDISKKINRFATAKKKILDEPENFYVISDNKSLLLNSNEEVKSLLLELRDTKFDNDIAKLYSQYENDIDDLTDD